MTVMLSILFASGVGFGLAFWICGTLLEKSNNFGDSKGDKGEYRAYADFREFDDNLKNSTYSDFIARYSKCIDNGNGPKGTELVRRLTAEEIQRYNSSDGTPRGIDHAERWGEPVGESLKGIFKPLEDEDRTGF